MVMKKIKMIFHYIVVFSMVLSFVFISVPIRSNAVIDPVSAITLYNGLAQAISAYGASNGISMMFSNNITSNIGSGIHDLWEEFKTDHSELNVPTYDSLAINVWSTLFRKVGNNVGVFIDDTVVPLFNDFWSWLLEQKANLTKNENGAYVFNSSDLVPIYAVPTFYNQPVTYYPYDSSNLADYYNHSLVLGHNDVDSYSPAICSTDTNKSIYCFVDVSHNKFVVVGESLTYFREIRYLDGGSYIAVNSLNSTSIIDEVTGLFYYSFDNTENYDSFGIPVFSDRNTGLNEVLNSIDGIGVNSIFLEPTYGDQVLDTPQDIYIPDNDDVNYEPLPFVGPFNIPWDFSKYGNGVGDLDDTQLQNIVNDITQAITDSGTTVMEGSETADSFYDTFHSILPFNQLPSFQFNLSGIWYYVVGWVNSLGTWLTTMFGIWSVIPYYISLPVYASAVVVIVLGVYKRFFM